MKAAHKRHYWRNEEFCHGARVAALMITALIIVLAWELETK